MPCESIIHCTEHVLACATLEPLVSWQAAACSTQSTPSDLPVCTVSFTTMHTLQACDAAVNLKDKSHKPPAVADLFHVGQLVRAIIIGLDQQPRAGASNSKSGKKTISLSLQVSKVNSALTSETIQRNVPLPACVTSVEDHGYTLSFGIKGVTGFLSKKNQGNGKKEDAAGLKPGMLIECVAQNQKAKQKTVKVIAAPCAVTDTLTEDYPGLSIGKACLCTGTIA